MERRQPDKEQERYAPARERPGHFDCRSPNAMELIRVLIKGVRVLRFR